MAEADHAEQRSHTAGSVNGTVVAMDQAVQDSAAAVGAEHVSLIFPNVIKKDMISVDGVLVNDSGQAAIAGRVLNALRT